MYKHALNLKDQLLLTKFEIHQVGTQIRISLMLAGVGLIAAFMPFVLPDQWVPLAGFCYALIGVVYFVVERSRELLWQKTEHS
jgi:hypothetical protein